MTPCADRRETLFLDIHGELPRSERQAWEKHLETCAGCRQERHQLARLLEVATETLTTPALPAERAERLRHSIRRSWMAEQPPTRWWQGLLVGPRLRPVPGVAAVCLLLVVLGWFGWRGFQGRWPNGPVGENPARILVSDLEVVENLDLLEDMDDIKRVVRVVDDRDILL